MSLTYHQQRLADLRDRYANRRTVSRQLLDEATGLVDSALVELQARHETQLAEADRQHGAQVARLEARATRVEDRVRELEAMRTNLRESRETIDDGVLVKITAPRTTTWRGENSDIPRPWTLGELEAVAYRLRLGGGTDDTEVRIKHQHTEATIPYPELVLDAPAKTTLPEEPPTSRWWSRTGAQVAIGAVLGVLLVAITMVIGGAS
jgi:hypothetical protein